MQWHTHTSSLGVGTSLTVHFITNRVIYKEELIYSESYKIVALLMHGKL